MKTTLAILAATIATVTASTLIQPEDPWLEIAAPVSIDLPAPLDEIRWRTDLRAAARESRLTGRPLFVTLRCLPCKQCSEFDATVLDGSRDLSPLLKQFITVRLTNAADLDLAILPAEGYQDFDLSWWGYFLSPDLRTYAVFGGKDHVSDTTRISEAALVSTMQRVLEHHYDPRRENWDVDGEAPDPRAAFMSPTELPAYESWRNSAEWVDDNCLHCHQVGETYRQPLIDSGEFDSDRDLAVWPLPENVGIMLDRDHGLRVTSVERGSAAAAAGLQAGDILLGAHDRRLFGQADFRGVLHREANPAGSILVRWTRDGELMSGTLELEEGWRATQVWWRASVSGGNIGIGPGFWPLKGPRNSQIAPGTMSVKPWFGQNPRASAPRQAGLRGNHVIVAVNGESPDVAERKFQTWFRLRFKRGDDVTLTVLENGQKRDITYTLPN